jgi:hypothetical protein
MKVITNAPIFYSSADGIYSSALGKTVAEIKEFQSWYNAHKEAKNPALIVDGKAGAATKTAYLIYARKYDASLYNPSQGITYGEQVDSNPPPKRAKTATKAADKPAEETKDKTAEEKPSEKKSLMDKFKELSMPKKVGVVAIPFLIIGAVVYFKMRKK